MTKKPSIKAEIKADVTEGTNKVLTSAAGAIDSSKKFLGKVFNEGAEEIGRLLTQEFRGWRTLRAIELTTKIQERIEATDLPADFTIHPRIGYEILYQGSLQDDDLLQDWWSGIFVTSLAKEPSDEALIFLDLKKSISSSQAKILKYLIERSEVMHTQLELFYTKGISITFEDLVQVTGSASLLRLDREIDSLRYLGLIDGGFSLEMGGKSGKISLTALGLQFYARCNGVKDNLHIFYNAKEQEECPKCGNRHPDFSLTCRLSELK